MVLNLDIRSYQAESAHHQHDFTQLVLPICGRMEIDVDGRGGSIDNALAALVRPGSQHAQLAQPGSRFLVLDCAPMHCTASRSRRWPNAPMSPSRPLPGA
ncbi:hypothetical protein NWF32_28795 [Pseudomonas qingdaonensis]|nr:hypothetical protein [Pseudomonas qingdaonensis]